MLPGAEDPDDSCERDPLGAEKKEFPDIAEGNPAPGAAAGADIAEGNANRGCVGCPVCAGAEKEDGNIILGRRIYIG